jgi:vacuolar-type H+-ATPase subunit I/STV1
MRHRTGRRGNVVALIQPGKAIDDRAEIKDTLVALKRLHSLLATLATRRRDAMNAFLRTFAADLATAGETPSKALVDAHIARFAVRKSADDELTKRIDVLDTIRVALEHRIGEFARTNRDEVIKLLQQQIAALKQQPQKPGPEQGTINQSIAVLQAEVDRLREPEEAKPSTAARRRKK